MVYYLVCWGVFYCEIGCGAGQKVAQATSMVPRKRSFVAVGLVAVVGVAAAVGFVAIVQNPSLVQNPIVEVSTPRWRTFVTVALAGIVLFSSFYLLWRLPDLLRSRALHKRFPDSLILSGSRTDSAFGSGANTPPTSHQLSDSRPGRVIPSSYPLWFCVEINDSGFNLWHRASDELPIMSEVWGNVHAARWCAPEMYDEAAFWAIVGAEDTYNETTLEHLVDELPAGADREALPRVSGGFDFADFPAFVESTQSGFSS